MSEEFVHIQVLTGSGSLVTERLTRDLAGHLADQDIDVQFADDLDELTGHKGVIGESLTLLVGVATSAGATTVLATVVKEWCRRDRHRRVEFRLADRVLVLDGNPADQLAIIDRFVSAGSAEEPSPTATDAADQA